MHSTPERHAHVLSKDQTTHGVRATLSQILREMEVAPAWKHGDRVMLQLVRLVADNKALSPEVKAEYVYGTLRYIHTRTRSLLLLLLTSGHDRRQEQSSSAVGHWQMLGDLANMAVEQGAGLGLFILHTHMSNYIASTGFQISLEVMIRSGFGGAALDVKTVSLFTHLAFRLKLGMDNTAVAIRSMDDSAEDTSPSVENLLSLLATIRKLQLLIISVQTALGMTAAIGTLMTDHGEWNASTALHCPMLTLLQIHEILPGRRVSPRLVLQINRALLTQQEVLGRCRPCNDLRIIFQIPRLLQVSGGDKQWRENVAQLTPTVGRGVGHGCHNPSCVSLEGITDHAMKTRLCSGCRLARYCSRGCQGVDRVEHSKTCVS